MPKPDDPTKENSISELAREFMRIATRRPGSAEEDKTETAAGKKAAPKVRFANPVTAGVLSLFLWGGGFLYLGRPIPATAALFLLLASGTLFGAFSGILPAWMGSHLLKDLRWTLPLGPSLVISGAALCIVWWLSVVLPTVLARRETRTYRVPGKITLLLLCPFPMIGHFSQGKFRLGYLFGIFYFLAPAAWFAVARLWDDSVLLPLSKVAALESHFILWGVVFGLSFLLAALGFASSFLGALNRIGWLQSRRDGGETEWKFVVLGSVVALVALLYAFSGRPGHLARTKVRAFSVQVEARGFLRSAQGIAGGARLWEQGAMQTRDYVERFR